MDYPESTPRPLSSPLSRCVAALALALTLAPLACSDDGAGTETDVSATQVDPSNSSTDSSSPTTGPEPTTVGPTDPSTTSTTGPGTTSTTGEPVPLVPVGHDREFRGAWVASVYNINYPSMAGLDVSTLEDELLTLVDTLEMYHFNAVVFQVRPESDALYASTIEPWSRWLSGTQGVAPDGEFDPLEYLIEVAHDRNIEVHAWFNPYRAKVNKDIAAAQGHVSLAMPEHAHVYGNNLWMDPGAPEVREWVVDVITDVVDNYDIDGVHFDDYFYPYPDGQEFPDSGTYADYQGNGGMLEKDDWRRDNVNNLVADVSEAIAASRPDVRFGIGPFGIYRPGIPEGIVGLDQWAQLFADPVVWIEQGWVDYLAPQLYWPSTQAPQAYGVLIEWWASLTAEHGGYIFAGNYLSQVGSEPKWSVDEFVTQVELTRAQAGNGALGNIYYNVDPVLSDSEGVMSTIADAYYGQPVLTPPLAAFAGETVAHPQVTLDGDTVELAPPDGVTPRAYVVYINSEGEWALDSILPGDTMAHALIEGTSYAISVVDRRGVESQGVLVEP